MADIQDVEQDLVDYGTFNGIFARNGVFFCSSDDEWVSNLVTVQDSESFEEHWDDTRYDQLFTSPDGGIHVVGTDSTKRYNDFNVEFQLIQIGSVLTTPINVYPFSTVLCKYMQPQQPLFHLNVELYEGVDLGFSEEDGSVWTTKFWRNFPRKVCGL